MKRTTELEGGSVLVVVVIISKNSYETERRKSLLTGLKDGCSWRFFIFWGWRCSNINCFLYPYVHIRGNRTSMWKVLWESSSWFHEILRLLKLKIRWNSNRKWVICPSLFVFNSNRKWVICPSYSDNPFCLSLFNGCVVQHIGFYFDVRNGMVPIGKAFLLQNFNLLFLIILEYFTQ